MIETMLLEQPLETLGLSDHACMSLWHAGVTRVEELIAWSEAGFKKRPGMAKRLSEQIRAEIARALASLTRPVPVQSKHTDLAALLLQHRGLVNKFIRSHYSRIRDAGLNTDDAFQIGLLGLKRALEQYDEQRGAIFSTYAWYWIRCYIRRAIAQAYGVPDNFLTELARWRRCEKDLAQCFQRAVNLEEIEQALKWGPKKLLRFRHAYRFGFARQQVGDFTAPCRNAKEKVSGYDVVLLRDTILERQGVRPEQRSMENEQHEIVARLLPTLSVSQRRVVELSFGLGDGYARSLKEVGTIIGLTRERVRQILAKAFERLRRGVAARLLAPYRE